MHRRAVGSSSLPHRLDSAVVWMNDRGNTEQWSTTPYSHRPGGVARVERYTTENGGRVMFPIVSAGTVVPVLYLGLAGHSSLTALLIGGFFLGIGGTAFAVGVPLVSAWFPPERRGLAIGIFGAGMGGTAISALTTVKLVDAYGMASPFLITAGVLAVYAVVAVLMLRDAPGRTVLAEPLARRLAATLRLGITWQASALYAVAFGGYVAFSVYLPTYLRTGYGLTQADAARDPTVGETSRAAPAGGVPDFQRSAQRCPGPFSGWVWPDRPCRVPGDPSEGGLVRNDMHLPPNPDHPEGDPDVRRHLAGARPPHR
ncbi:MFS transporter [Streptomyces sp. NPDC059866]|uniref:MFS transporter n=1 Tax=Streptomyces sp. NPDC059866 TaxID=3346978 RepID=UPI003662E3D1